MPDASRVLLQRLQAAFDTVVARRRPRASGIRPRRLPGERRPCPGEAGRPAAASGGRGGRGGGLPRRHLRGGGGQRPRIHQPDALGGFRRRPGGRPVRRPEAGRGRGGSPGDHRHRLLGPERGQGDARRASAQHADRRRTGACPGVPRSRRAAREPHRRLGHAVRHADRAPGGRRRGRERRDLQRAGPQRVLRGGAPAVRLGPRLRRAVPAAGRPAAGRGRGDAAAVADLRGRVDAPRPRGVRHPRRAPDRSTTSWARASTTRCCRSWSRSSTPRASSSRTAARCACSPRASRTATASRCRSSCASPTVGTATRPPTWPACATGPAGSAPRGWSTSSAPSSRCTCASSSRCPRWPGTCRRPRPPCTCRSASCWEPTARSWPAAAEGRSASSTSWRKGSNGPRPR